MKFLLAFFIIATTCSAQGEFTLMEYDFEVGKTPSVQDDLVVPFYLWGTWEIPVEPYETRRVDYCPCTTVLGDPTIIDGVLEFDHYTPNEPFVSNLTFPFGLAETNLEPTRFEFDFKSPDPVTIGIGIWSGSDRGNGARAATHYDYPGGDEWQTFDVVPMLSSIDEAYKFQIRINLWDVAETTYQMDNVRISGKYMPEPSSLMIATLGILSLTGRTRRGRSL